MVESSGTLRDADLRGDGVQPYAQISRLAVVSLVLALFGCLVVPIPFALVLGVMAIRRIRASKGAVVGMPVAVGGVVLAVAMIVGWGVFLHLRSRDRRRAEEQSAENVRRFFDWVARGYLDDAFALLSTGAQKEVTVEDLRKLSESLQAAGRLEDVRFVSARWGAMRPREGGKIPIFSREAKMTFVVRFTAEERTYEISVVRQGDAWRLEAFSIKAQKKLSAG